MFENKSRSGRWWALVPPVAAAICATLFWLLLTPESLQWLKAENGPIEGTNALLYGVCALVFLLAARTDAATRLALAVLFAGFAAREMDWHKAFTGKSVLKLSWYLEDGSWGAKAVAAVCVAAVALAAATLLLRHAGAVWRGLWRGEAVAASIAVFVVTMAATKVLDRSLNILIEDFGMVFAPATGLLVGSLEETVELALPLIALVAWWQQRAARR